MLDKFIYNWFEKLNAWRLSSFKHKSLVIQRTIAWKIIKHTLWNWNSQNHDDFLNKFRINDKNIALIWNSPNLKEQNYGNDIDSHNLIIRLNTWILPSHLSANKTWVKTNLWATQALHSICHPDIWIEITANKEKYENILIWLSEIPQADKHYFDNLYIKYFKLRKHNLYFTPKEKYQKLLKMLNSWNSIRYSPSTWFVFFMFLLDLCENNNISLYWFTFSNEHRILSDAPAIFHDFKKEKEIILQKISENDNINIYQ